ncbi:hypothetical protein ERJ75_001711600 [Trypanosoma vivax]|nr:hypothetical protein ERJ75_001711600 [Trypanosoma vivax]
MAARGRFASPSTTGASLATRFHGMGSGRHRLVGEGAKGEKRGLVGVKRTGQAREDDYAVVARPCRHRVAERGGACGEQAIRGGGNWGSVRGGEQARGGGRGVHVHRGGREGHCARRSGDSETAGAGTDCEGGGKRRGSSRQHDNGEEAKALASTVDKELRHAQTYTAQAMSTQQKALRIAVQLTHAAAEIKQFVTIAASLVGKHAAEEGGAPCIGTAAGATNTATPTSQLGGAAAT